MNSSTTIEAQLEEIIKTGYNILDSLQYNELELADVKKLFARRRKQLDELYQTKSNKEEIAGEKQEQLRKLFTRLSLLEKSINNVFATLSLQYRKSIKDIGLQKKAKKSYNRSIAGTSKILDTQIKG